MARENRRAVKCPQVVRELKRDAFGRVELLDGPLGQCVRRVADGSRLPGTRFLAHRFLARERRALERVAEAGAGASRGVACVLDRPDHARVPSLDGRSPRSSEVLVRTWIEGVPLWQTEALPEDFFERLEDLVRDLHAAGVCHNDLHKEPNLLVGSDGRPAVLDFQLASVHRRFGRTWRVRAEEDLRHVEKHRDRYLRATGRRGETRVARKRSLVARLWMLFGKPVYNLVVRRALAREDGEPRRPADGPWPSWTPSIGPSRAPRAGSSSRGDRRPPTGSTRDGTARPPTVASGGGAP